ncbi:MAG: SIS domain-containing protein [Oscillospiraceae bacterium]
MTIKYVDDSTYINKICDMLQVVEHEEVTGIEEAALVAFNSIQNGGLLHVFSTGHSHMIVEEMFYRAGGLIPVNPILDNSLMLHEGAITSTENERLHGKAQEVLSKVNLQKGDTIIVSSNTGINAVPVEAALYAKSMGVTVIGVTSVEASKELKSRHIDGKKLYEVSDIVVDNHAPIGDGMVYVPTNGQMTGGASTFSSLFIAQRIVLKIENLYLANGLTPPIFMSANIPGGDEHNARAITKYQDRIRALR